MKTGSNRARKGDEGFTLVELMVTVTIIGILAAVAIPRYVSYVRSSQTAEVGQMAGAMVAAMRAYVDQQGLTTATAATLFDARQLTRATPAPAANFDLTTLIPQLALQSSSNFSYTVSAIAGTGTQANEVLYCIKAVGGSTSGLPAGVVLYSAITPASGATGWDGRLNRVDYLNGVTGTVAFTAGGSCSTAGTATAGA